VASVANQTYGAPTLISAILITAQLDTADHAARVANDFAQGILDRGSEGQLATTRATFDFYAQQEKPVWAQITALEQEIATYKNANAAALPTRRDAQNEELVNLETERRALEQTIVGLESERAAIEATGAPRATERRTIADLTARIAVLNQQKSALDARRTEVETALSAIPDVERVLNTFDRRLRQLQDQYTVITTRMAEAQTALQLAEGQQTERFSMLERAITPDYPVSSGAKKLAAAGGVVSILLALGVAFMLDLLKPVVRTAAQMQRQLGIVPVVSIPEISAGTVKSRTRLATAALALADGRKPMLGLPRYAMIFAGATLFLMVAAAAIA